MDHLDYLKQMEQFYNGRLPSHREIRLGETPDILKKYGAPDLPLVLKQKTLRKCIREPSGSKSAHALSRDIIETIPDELKAPILIIDNPERDGLLIMTGQQDHKARQVVAAIHFNNDLYGQKVNEVKTIFGREGLNEYLLRESENIVYLDKEKAKKLSPTIGLQLPEAPITLDYAFTIQNTKLKVNNKNQENTYQKPVRENMQNNIARDLRANGFQPTKSLLVNIQRLNRLTEKENSLKEICDYHNNPDQLDSLEARGVVKEIAAECQEQEIEQLQFPPPDA